MSLVRHSKRAYAAGARSVGRGLRRVGVVPHDHPSRDQRWRHWFSSLGYAHDSVALVELDVPWWTYDAIDAVDDWLLGRTSPVSVFEWGSGASTVWLAKRADRVVSIEHHREFGEMMQGVVASARLRAATVDIRIVEPTPSAQPVVRSSKEGHAGLDFSEYVKAIETASGPFDMIVIDGRAREACLASALDHVAPGGMIVFDNTLRRRYRSAIAELGPLDITHHSGLTPTLPYPERTSLLRPVVSR